MRGTTGRIALLAIAAARLMTGQQLQISLQLDRLYPSTVMVHEIHVSALTTAPLPQHASDYEVSVNGAARPGLIIGVRPAKNGQTHQTDTSVIFLLVSNQAVKEGDEVLVRTTETPARTSAAIKAPAQAPNFALTLTPAFVQSAGLKNGQKRAVGQLGVAFNEMTLTPGWRNARTYLSTNSFISSDAKDKQSTVNLAFGLERSLLKRWYLPFRAETKLVGDQVIDNASSVSSAGVASLIPWGWTAGLLRNPVFDAPVSPDVGIDVQFEQRLRQDAFSRNKFADKSALRLHGRSTWANIRLLKGNGNGDPVELEVAGQGWYLPHQHTGGATGRVLVDRLEGMVEVSVLVPISKIAVTRTGIATPQKGTKSVIRVKYARGANEANGFRHFSQLSLGVEVTGAK